MYSSRYPVVVLCASIVLGGVVLAAQRLPIVPPKGFGTSITGAFEGWFENPGGNGKSFLVGYYNRNLERDIDIPVGPNNRIEPGGPDQGQPTHFLHGRRVGMFVVPVPSDFTTADQRLIWTITVNGESTQIPLRMPADYNVSPFTDLAVGNKPPAVRFSESGAPIQGPIATIATATPMKASVQAPLTLEIWATDDAKYSSGTNAPMRNPPPPVTIFWSKFRGTGSVTFGDAEPKLDVLQGGNVNEEFRGHAKTTATFSEPGSYILQLTANDYSGDGGGGEVCCWTTAMVNVTVTP